MFGLMEVGKSKAGWKVYERRACPVVSCLSAQVYFGRISDVHNKSRLSSQVARITSPIDHLETKSNRQNASQLQPRLQPMVLRAQLKPDRHPADTAKARKAILHSLINNDVDGEEGSRGATSRACNSDKA